MTFPPRAQITQTDTFVARNVTEFNSGGVLHVNRRKHEVEGRPPGGLLGFVEWVLLAMVVTGWYIAQFYQWAYRPQLRMWWPVFAGSWVGVHLIHWVLTVRDGYMVSLTHMLRMPSILKASSSRPDAECWLSAPMHMKWKLFWTNALFWGVVLAMKLPFDYFVLAKPVVQPLIIVNQRNYLQCQGRWCVVGAFWALSGGCWVVRGGSARLKDELSSACGAPWRCLQVPDSAERRPGDWRAAVHWRRLAAHGGAHLPLHRHRVHGHVALLPNHHHHLRHHQVRACARVL